MENSFIYLFEGKSYQVVVKYKKIKNIHYRFNGVNFLISCPKRTSLMTLKSGLDKFAKKLIDRCSKFALETEDYIYIFAEKYELTYPGTIVLRDTVIHYKTNKDFHNKLRGWFLNYLKEQTKKEALRMNAPCYEVKVRKMSTRYGTNNKNKKTITYSYSLIHYDEAIIDSVIIHELSHCFVYNHSNKFYDVLYKYCPKYNEYRRKLLKMELK